MTVQSLITAELLLVSIFLCLYMHTLQRSQFVKQMQAWLNYLRGKQRRQLRPNTPQECPLCAAPGSPVNQPNGSVRIRSWAEQKSVQGRKKRVSSEGYCCPNAVCVYFKVTDESKHALVSNGWRGQRERIRQWR